MLQETVMIQANGTQTINYYTLAIFYIHVYNYVRTSRNVRLPQSAYCNIRLGLDKKQMWLYIIHCHTVNVYLYFYVIIWTKTKLWTCWQQTIDIFRYLEQSVYLEAFSCRDKVKLR